MFSRGTSYSLVQTLLLQDVDALATIYASSQTDRQTDWLTVKQTAVYKESCQCI